MSADSQRQGRLDAHVVLRRDGFTLDAHLSAEPGEVLVVLGPNGAGKSTTLRAVAGLAPLDAGVIRIGEQVWDDGGRVFVPAHRRACALVFQDYRLFGHLSVLDNVAFGGRRARGRRSARDAAWRWLETLDVAELADRRPAQLSGGQAQRVALARALAATPDVLLLDEPLAALDARTRVEVRGTLRRHLTSFAGPSLLVTHDPLEAVVLADRVLVLEGGRVTQHGAPTVLARRPATQYVARLMGLNLLPGRLVTGGRVDLDAGGALVAADRPDDVPAPRPGAAVLVAVAPSAVSLHDAPPEHGSARNVWSGTVSEVELLGDRVRVAVAGAPSVVVDVTVAAVADLMLAPGRPVWLTAKATEVSVYPA